MGASKDYLAQGYGCNMTSGNLVRDEVGQIARLCQGSYREAAAEFQQRPPHCDDRNDGVLNANR